MTESSGPSPWLTAAQAEQGAPIGTPPGNLYFAFKKPDGDEFVGPASSAEEYLKLGYTVTGEHTVEDSDSFRDLVSPGSLEPPASGVESTEATANSGAMPAAAPPAA
ncbi:MAG TPA: hypothetical protein VFB50_11665 [Chloroflexota bacterium]|nr:hypothetical protein [Chloroflexota bacterium]